MKLLLIALAFSTQTNTPADSITRDGYTLIVYNNEPSFDTTTKRRLIEAFFEVYPKEANRFNPKTSKTVTFTIDPSYNGVAETGEDKVRYNPRWLKDHPEDIDVVTHEVMHIVQDYRYPVPGWLTEGIADYARYVYGVNNAKGNWKLPEYKETQHYTDAYRVTARFLLWVEKKKCPGIVDSLDKAAREGKYTYQLWAKLTGMSVESLWEEYKKDPIISDPLSRGVSGLLPDTSRPARAGK
ncbi:MAG: secretory protein [Bacteroidetes bacterium]|nr:secretory protein [Bacteroidota bacterium]